MACAFDIRRVRHYERVRGTRSPGSTCAFSLLVHEVGPERALGRELIVCSTSESQIFCRRIPSARHLLNMVVLDELTRFAALAGLADERALAAIAQPDGALHVRGNVASTR